MDYNQWDSPDKPQFRLSQTSGLLTVVAAGTATAGHLFAFRWGSSEKSAAVRSITCKWRTIAGFTAAQEVGLNVIRATAYTASHSGGTAWTLTAPNGKKRTNTSTTPATVLTDARIATTGELTAGTHTFDAEQLDSERFAELAAAATVHKGRFDLVLDFERDYGGPLVLKQDEGFVVRNSILMGAGGTARLTVCVDWTEIYDRL